MQLAQKLLKQHAPYKKYREKVDKKLKYMTCLNE